MTTLLVDVGNSYVKCRFEGSVRVYRCETESLPEGDFIVLLQSMRSPQVLRVLACCVASDAVKNTITSACSQCFGVDVSWCESAKLQHGLVNGYRQFKQLGNDRWVAMQAAIDRYRGLKCLVVDAGSAVTLDYINAKGSFEGGLILPGAHLMQNSLVGGTARIEVSMRSNDVATLGRSTYGAVMHGVRIAEIGAVREAVDRIFSEAGGLDVIVMSGGNGLALFSELLNPEKVYVPEIVLAGLEVIARCEQ